MMKFVDGVLILW